MNAANYKRSITVSARPKDVYLSLTAGYEHWWTSPDKPLIKVGDISKFGFTDRFGYWCFEAMELSPRKIVLQCVEARHIQPDKPKEIETEWLGTRLIWRIQEQDNATTVHFEHDGLTPELHCFEICCAGWDAFFVGSLEAYLNTGVGRPFGAGS